MYNECPKRYEFHYERKFRSKGLGSALFFGVALDEALNVLLLSKKKKLTDKEQKEAKKLPKDVFLKNFTEVNHLGSVVEVMNYDMTQYASADFDSSLLEDSDLEDIGQDRTYCEEFVEWFKEQVKGKKTVTIEELKTYNKINWHSLKRKGLLILERYEQEVLPKILEVHSIQERVHLPNQNGDSIDGIIDFTATFVDEPNKIYVCDNKTASKAYKESDLAESDQLHLYAYYKNMENIAYIVCEKNIRKREPRVRITIMRGTVNEDFTDNLVDNYAEVLYKLREGDFKPNYQSGCMFFGRRCAYYDLCHHGKFDDDTLVCMEKKSDK